MSKDPWKHRAKQMRCSSCMWFVAKEQKQPDTAIEIPMPVLGRCRRHAPTHDGFPAVFEQDWCGDHKLDENKTS